MKNEKANHPSYDQLSVEQVRDLCLLYKQGGFDSEAKLYLAELGIGFTPKMWREWLKNEAFADDIDAFREYARAFWERTLRENIGNKAFNLPAWYKAVQHRWDEYAEKPAPLVQQNTVIQAGEKTVANILEKMWQDYENSRKMDVPARVISKGGIAAVTLSKADYEGIGS